MRFVPIKTDDQLDLQALHRVRDRLMERRTFALEKMRFVRAKVGKAERC
jgi:transposase